jgi:transposase-like protein
MISIRRFMERFSDEEACRQFFIRLRWPHGFVCPRCGECNHSIIQSRRLYECTACKAQISVTTGTVMHRTKLPLRYWLFVFYWAASGERCSARKLSLTLKLNYRTALRMLHAVRTAMSGTAAGNRPFTFWMPARNDFMRRVNAIMKDHAERFIRSYYRRVSDRNRTSYFSEFHFRFSNEFNPKQALTKLLVGGVSAGLHAYKGGYPTAIA